MRTSLKGRLTQLEERANESTAAINITCRLLSPDEPIQPGWQRFGGGLYRITRDGDEPRATGQ